MNAARLMWLLAALFLAGWAYFYLWRGTQGGFVQVFLVAALALIIMNYLANYRRES